MQKFHSLSTSSSAKTQTIIKTATLVIYIVIFATETKVFHSNLQRLDSHSSAPFYL